MKMTDEERTFLAALIDVGRHAKTVVARIDASLADFERERQARPSREARIRAATIAAFGEAEARQAGSLTPSGSHSIK